MSSPLPGLRAAILSSRSAHLPGLSTGLLREYHDYPSFPTDSAGVPQARHLKTNKKWHYMHGHSSNEGFIKDGVSDKIFPVPIEWRRPNHVYRRIQHPEGSGDGSGIPFADIDMLRPRPEYAGGAALEDAPPEVKRVLSLEFGRNKEVIEAYEGDLVRQVQRHKGDFSSLEVAITTLTIQIRNNQHQYTLLNPHGDTTRGQQRLNRKLGHILKSMVDHRRVLLRYLRERDYKRFEWLLEKLDLYYRPRPFFWERVERKKHLGRLVDLYCDEIKQHKLDEMRAKLDEESVTYLQEKAETLKWMLKEERELGLDTTVNESDIEECLKKAEEMAAKVDARKGGRLQESYYVFEPEVKQDVHNISDG